MIPVSQIPNESLKRVHGVIFDIDDTLTRDGRLEREAFDALWQLHQGGFKLIAATGRPLGWVDVIARQWPVDLAIGENGAGWVSSDGHTIREGYRDNGPMRALQQVQREGLIADMAQAFPDLTLTQDHQARRCDMAWDIGETHSIAPTRVQEAKAWLEKQGALSVTSSIHLHAMFSHYTKREGIVLGAQDVLGSDLSAEKERWIFVGDSLNDESCFGYFPLSVGVANVTVHQAKLTHLPRYITEADRGRGFAEIAHYLLNLR